MDELIYSILDGFPTLILLVIIGLSLYILGKGADILVNEAIGISIKRGISKVVIGGTIVSLGTTIPEVTVSVFAAINGNPGLALGNAIGSIFTNMALILGLAALIGRVPMDRRVIGKQGAIELISVFLLTIVTLPILSSGSEGRVTQWMGLIFLALLVLYIIGTISSSKKSNNESLPASDGKDDSLILQIIKLIFGVALVVLSSKILIPSVEMTAIRIGIPQSIIAATLVALGTSLPELVTSLTAVRKGHGELAVGNILGANILNILFVIGSSAAVTKGGLLVPIVFYKLQIPAMIIISVLFYMFSKNKRGIMTKLQGLIFLSTYVVYLILNYVFI
jgi:cation:H+ antiporter